MDIISFCCDISHTEDSLKYIRAFIKRNSDEWTTFLVPGNVMDGNEPDQKIADRNGPDENHSDGNGPDEKNSD